MNFYEEEIKDHGFDEPDNRYLFNTVDDEVVEIKKNRVWFDDVENMMSDYYITWSLVVDGKVFMNFPKDVSEETVVSFANMQFQKDEQLTKEREEYEREVYWETKMRLQGKEW